MSESKILTREEVEHLRRHREAIGDRPATGLETCAHLYAKLERARLEQPLPNEATEGHGFVVEISKDCWLAAVDGDPGRTLVREHARRYRTRHGARTALGMARRWRPLPNAKIYEVPDVG